MTLEKIIIHCILKVTITGHDHFFLTSQIALKILFLLNNIRLQKLSYHS